MKSVAAGVLAVALALAAGTPCRAMEVSVRHDAGVDFSAYRTYAWKERANEPPNHPLAEGSPLDRQIRAQVDKGLARAGLELLEGDDAEPDLRLSYVAFVEDELTVEGTRREIAPGIAWVGDPDARALIHFTKGTLVISVEDMALRKGVWTGWATDIAADVVRLRKKAEKAAARIIQHYPPGR